MARRVLFKIHSECFGQRNVHATVVLREPLSELGLQLVDFS
jgi:hypothetical protein